MQSEWAICEHQKGQDPAPNGCLSPPKRSIGSAATIPTIVGATPTILGTTPTILGATPTILGTTPTILGTTPTIVGATPILGTIATILGTTPTILGTPLWVREPSQACHWFRSNSTPKLCCYVIRLNMRPGLALVALLLTPRSWPSEQFARAPVCPRGPGLSPGNLKEPSSGTLIKAWY